MNDARIPTSEQLMAEMAWVRQLARALLKDASVADDIAQDAWLVATEKQPDSDRPLRPWLGRVVRKLIHTRRRSDARRSERDETYADDRAVATPEQLVERVQLQRAVADEVLALAEPYRSTVLLHFVEGLSSADIARQQRIPDGTVRRRLKVALDQLREALEKRANPPKRGWLAALIPLARWPGPAATVAAATGVLLVKKILAIVAVLVVLLLIGFIVLRRDDNAAAPRRSSAAKGETHATTSASAHGMEPLPAWSAQAGAPKRRIAGHVIAAEGPVAGASVKLGFNLGAETTTVFVLPDGLMQMLQPLFETTTGPDGAFDFGEQPAARFTVSASAPEHAAGTVQVSNAEPHAKPDQLVVRLPDCTVHVSGTIIDASGGGVAHARVEASDGGTTDADGNGAYRLCIAPRRALGSPSAQLRISADGYGTVRYELLAVSDQHLDVQLVPEATLVGRVTRADGTAVPHARVIAVADSGGGVGHVTNSWTTSDDEGRFQISRLAPAAFRLFATTDGLTNDTGVSAFAQPTRTSREVRIVVSPRGRVVGTVVANGVPVSGAHVFATSGTAESGEAFSQSDGTFELDRVPLGHVRVIATNYQVSPPVELDVKQGETHDVRLDVTPMAQIHGRVLHDGAPVAGANILYMGPAQRTALSGADGSYSLEGLPPGAAQIFAQAPQLKALAYGTDFVFDPGEDATFDFDLDRSGEVTGTVVDEAGAPMAFTGVRFDIDEPGNNDKCETTTDAAGRFDCIMLVGGTYRPSVLPQSGARTPLPGMNANVVVPMNGVLANVTLTVRNQRVAIRGTVIDDAGEPLSDVLVEAVNGGGRTTMDFPSTMSSATGRFEIANLAPGTYNLHAHAGDGSEAEVLGVVGGADSTVIKVQRAGALEGTLAGFTATPMITLSTRTADLTMLRRPTLDGTSYSCVGLAVGHYIVEARAGDEVDTQSLEILPGKTAHLDLRARPLGPVDGTVIDSAHKPLADMRCDAHILANNEIFMAPPAPSQQGTTDATGRFSLRAPIGRVRLTCFALQGTPVQVPPTDIDVTAAATKITIVALPSRPN
ncbi:MAG TPA: sigma-70 family RNA polymerase sigma factor [Kofleriaceae bacterium]|jgi:RNA polymerase sigma-70 factor (ECF subfamily)